MATTSNIYQLPNANADIVLDAFQDVGFSPSELNQEHYESARMVLNRIFSSWANKGVNLWAVDLQIIPLAYGIVSYPIDAATISILDVYLSSSVGSSLNDRIMKSISRSEYSMYPNKNQVGSPTVYWFDNLAPSQMYTTTTLGAITSISGNGASATFTYVASQALATGAPIQITGCSVSGYNGIYFVTSSTIDAGVVTVIVPCLESQTVSSGFGTVILQSHTGKSINLYQAPNLAPYPFLKFYRLRQNQYSDVGNGQLPEIPFEYQDAFIGEIAARLSLKWKPEKYQMLRGIADESYKLAAERNVETANLIIEPDMGRYNI